MKRRLNLAKKLDITVAYAPQAEKTKGETYQFYEELSKRMDETPKNNMSLSMGDFNARVIEPTTDIEQSTMGAHASNGCEWRELHRAFGDRSPVAPLLGHRHGQLNVVSDVS